MNYSESFRTRIREIGRDIFERADAVRVPRVRSELIFYTHLPLIFIDLIPRFC